MVLSDGAINQVFAPALWYLIREIYEAVKKI